LSLIAIYREQDTQRS